tara:strand:+ start:725 stop:1330 length:606 start_codon:yes stop_codon:yes gene_type:complete
MNEELTNPKYVLEHIWLNLEQATKDRRHDYHNVTFTNLSKNNQVSSRTVILRNFKKKENFLAFNTDIRSPKINAIRYNNNCQLLFYSKKLKEQLRIEVLSFVEHNNSITKKAWNKTQVMSRKCYMTSYPPGTEINEPSDGIPKYLKGKEPKKNESEIGFINFSVIINYIQSIDWLFLSSQGHKRLFFYKLNGKWKSKWKIP